MSNSSISQTRVVRPASIAGVTRSAGRLTLNLELLDLPRELGEFVIVHELVHLLAPNHGKVFKSFLHAYMPDWGRREAALQGRARRLAGAE